MTDEENIAAYDACLAHIRNMPQPKSVEWWHVENTGFSGGVSWFASGGSVYEPRRFTNSQDAEDYIKRNRWDDPAVKWRYVHTMVEQEENKTITTEIWTEIT